MKRYYIPPLIIIVFSCLTSYAQTSGSDRLQQLRAAEDSMKYMARDIIQRPSGEERFWADSLFTRLLVRTLKIPHSFHFPFDSLETISRLYAPDSSFRIITWQLVVNENQCRQHGAIQLNTKDGSLKLFPLIDKSDLIDNIGDTVTDHRAWIGAVYYRILMNQSGNKRIYTLLGYDENNERSTKKYMETLSWNEQGPIFGGRYIGFDADTGRKRPDCSRYVMEFKKYGRARLNYDEELGLIIAEHLQSETNEPNKKWTYVPDGDYEGFKWKNGKWVHIEKVFTQVTPEGQAPVPKPIREANGDPLIDKLNPPTPNSKKKGGGKKEQ
jgi:hypothetical protein